MIPAKEAAAAASEVPSAAQLSSEIHLDSLTSLASMADGQRDANSREANSGKEGNIEQAQKDAGSVDWSTLGKFSTEGNEQRAEQDEHFRRSPAQKRPHEPSEAKPGRTILQQSSSFPSLAVYEEADSEAFIPERLQGSIAFILLPEENRLRLLRVWLGDPPKHSSIIELRQSGDQMLCRPPFSCDKSFVQAPQVKRL